MLFESDSCKFSHQVVPLALIPILPFVLIRNLTTRWRHFGHRVAPHVFVIALDGPLALLSSSVRITMLSSDTHKSQKRH